jgi:hypothetical protein
VVALAIDRARLEEPAVALGDVLSSEPLTVAEAVLLAEALLCAPRGAGAMSAADVVVTESGAIKLVRPVGDPASCGGLLCEAVGVGSRPGHELAPVEQAAPAFVAAIRGLASGSALGLEALSEAAGAATLEPARIRARQRLRLRARQARPIARAVDVLMEPAPRRLERRFVDESALPAQQERRFVDKSAIRARLRRLRRPSPLVLAAGVTALLAAAFVAIAANLGTEPSVPSASNPSQAVWLAFDLGAQHRFAEAASLRSERLQAADPAGRSIRDRFGADGGVTLLQQRVVALDRVHGRATVAVIWTDANGRHHRGDVYLVNSRSGWLWDGGTVA